MGQICRGMCEKSTEVVRREENDLKEISVPCSQIRGDINFVLTVMYKEHSLHGYLQIISLYFVDVGPIILEYLIERTPIQLICRCFKKTTKNERQMLAYYSWHVDGIHHKHGLVSPMAGENVKSFNNRIFLSIINIDNNANANENENENEKGKENENSIIDYEPEGTLPIFLDVDYEPERTLPIFLDSSSNEQQERHFFYQLRDDFVIVDQSYEYSVGERKIDKRKRWFGNHLLPQKRKHYAILTILDHRKQSKTFRNYFMIFHDLHSLSHLMDIHEFCILSFILRIFVDGKPLSSSSSTIDHVSILYQDLQKQFDPLTFQLIELKLFFKNNQNQKQLLVDLFDLVQIV